MKYTDIPILMYHDISDVHNPWCVSPDEFKQQMRWLRDHGYKTISLTQLKKGIGDNQETQEKLVVLTFDDARQGVSQHAAPILYSYGFTATIFVVPGWIESKDIPKDIPVEEAYSQFMSWAELKKWMERGFDIGSHGYAHRNLVELSEEQLRQELERADQEIISRLNVKPKHFAYPFGKYSQPVVVAACTRYETAVTIQRGFLREPGRYARQWVMRDTSLAGFQRLLQKPRCSVCMIVKDEEQFLGDCLASVQGIADEIIVVDTGSTDRTKEIAGGFTDHVYEVAWADDFSAARNESLKRATGDWILVMDADEVLAVVDRETIMEGMNDWQVAGYQILTRNYSNDSTLSGWKPVPAGERERMARSLNGWFPSLKVRLFQRTTGAQFQGRIHELISEQELVKHGKVQALPVTVHHYGALKENSSAKLQWHISLGKQKIADNPQDAKAYYELGVQYKLIKQFELAEEMLSHAVRLDPEPLTPWQELGLVKQKLGKLGEAIATYHQVLQRQERHADAHFGLGFCYFRNQEMEKAVHHFQQAIRANPRFVEAYINLGAVLEKVENYKAAEECLKDALVLHPGNARAYHNLGVVYEKMMDIPQAIAQYEKALKLNYAKGEEVRQRVERLQEFLRQEEKREREIGETEKGEGDGNRESGHEGH